MDVYIHKKEKIWVMNLNPFDMQMKYQKLYAELIKILSGKKGTEPKGLVWFPVQKCAENNLFNCWEALKPICHIIYGDESQKQVIG